jgi:hypothetical protein
MLTFPQVVQTSATTLIARIGQEDIVSLAAAAGWKWNAWIGICGSLFWYLTNAVDLAQQPLGQVPLETVSTMQILDSWLG